MISVIPQNLIRLAENCPRPLYLVGGSVRDFLSGRFPITDWDIAGDMTEEELLRALQGTEIAPVAVYRNTGTVRLKDGDDTPYEYTRFRSDRYVRGGHAPSSVTFTRDIDVDAKRRDFTVNAVYYDVRAQKFCDPLGGIYDIQTQTLRTVAPARKVFGEDGLRLMRLARLSAETGFLPDEECSNGAAQNAALIKDIVPERVFSELVRLLNTDGQDVYRGLCILRDTGVLHFILPELTAGDKLLQNSYHSHDVLEHSIRCCMYAPASIRFAALLHDVGKPFCYQRDANFYAHAEEGARLAGEILARLKAPKRLTEETKTLILLHMRDFDMKMRENKVRREMILCYPLLSELFALRQADYTACRDDLSPAPAVEKWKNILAQMRAENAPLCLSELAVNGNDLKDAGVTAERIAKTLRALLLYAAEDGTRNTRERLLKHIQRTKDKI